MYKEQLTGLLKARLDLGRERYGHGVIVDDDTTKYGTRSNDWGEMAQEELLDCLIYVSAQIIRVKRATKGCTSKQKQDDNDEIMSMLIDYMDEPCRENRPDGDLDMVLRKTIEVTKLIVSTMETLN